MSVTIKAFNFEPSEQMKAMIIEKSQVFFEMDKDIRSCQYRLSCIRNEYECEIKLGQQSAIFIAMRSAPDMYSAILLAIDATKGYYP